MHLGFAAFGPTIIYFGGIVAFVLSIFWRPQAGLYFLVPLLPMQTARYWVHAYPLGEKLVDILLLGVVIGLVIHSKRPLFVSSPLNKVLILFFVVLYFALWEGAFFINVPLPFWIDDPRVSDWKNYVEMMLIFFIVAAVIRTPKQMAIVIGLMCFSVFIVNRSYHGIVGDRDLSVYSDSLREAGALGYAGENGMGAFQAQFAIFLIGLAGIMKKRLQKYLLLVLAATSIYCMVVTFSRGAYLGFLVGLFVMGILHERKLLIALAIILVSWQSFVPGAVRDRVLMTYQQGQGLDPSAVERVTIWEDALQVISHEPILGTGFDTYSYMGRVADYKDTHNYYLKVLVELGFVGLFIFLWILAASARMAWRLYRTAQDPFLRTLGYAVFATVACAVVVNLFGDRWTYLQVNGFLWAMLGLVARGLFIVKQEQEAAEVVSGTVTLGSSPSTRVSLI